LLRANVIMRIIGKTPQNGILLSFSIVDVSSSLEFVSFLDTFSCTHHVPDFFMLCLTLFSGMIAKC
jgi:hypothetical protein